MTRSMCVRAAAFLLAVFIVAPAQSVPVDNELKRVQGGWRIVELVEDGRVISPTEMRTSLPGGGLLEIVDYTVLFKSPVDGARSTRSFRLDPTKYPKRIALLDGDNVTGVGIYQMDQGKLVMCVANPALPVPTEFSAPKGSGRTMMVLEPKRPGDDAKFDVAPTPTKTRLTSTESVRTANQNSAVPEQTPAGRIISDAEVIRMLVGTWRLNDGEGLIDITINSNNTFSSYRHTQTMTNFHSVFVPTPVSAGTWFVQKGRLTLTISSSWRADRTNTRAEYAVRSISKGDAILVVALGRVMRASRSL